MAAVPHINNRRGGVWYFERRVPNDIVDRPDVWHRVFSGKILWRKSLRTKNKIDALERGYLAAREFETLLESCSRSTALAGSSAVAPTHNEERVPTPDEYKMVGHAERVRIRWPWRVASIRADVGGEASAKFKAEAADYMAGHAQRSAHTAERGYESTDLDDWLSPLTRAKQINVENGYHMSESSTHFGLLVGCVREGFLAADTDIRAIIGGATVPPEAISPMIKDARRINALLEQESPTLTETVEHYLKVGGSKGRLASRTQIGVRQALREFIEVVGDKPLHKIERKDIHSFIEAQGRVSVGSKAKGSVGRLASRSTVQKKLTFLRSPVAMAIDHSKFDGVNPFSGVTLHGFVESADPSVMVEKRAFETSELGALFKHPWFHGSAGTDDRSSLLPGNVRLQDHRFWGPVVALYTGCRAAELGGLRLADVRIDDAYPHFIVQPNSYRGTKNGKTRRVPILNALRSIAFDDYFAEVTKSGTDRLFPLWQPGAQSKSSGNADERWAAAKWPRAFNRTVIPAALRDFLVKGTRQAVTLHSFRGSFKRMLEDSGVNQQYVDDILGHSKNELDQRYSGTRSIKTLFEATHTLDFDRLVILSLASST